MFTEVPHFKKLLEFIDMRARASESTSRKPPNKEYSSRKVSTNFVSNTEPYYARCVLCKPERHPLYLCSKFKNMQHEQKLSVIRSNNLCMNCLKPGHFLEKCRSIHHCKKCQRKHHSILHVDAQEVETARPAIVSSNTSMDKLPETLLMTAQVLVRAPDGSEMKARALLDAASTSSFISERLAQSLSIPRSRQKITISGVAGLVCSSPFKSVATFNILPICSTSTQLSVAAVVVPRVICDLPLAPVYPKSDWTHINGISLADPCYDTPGRIDLLLGVDVYVESLLHGRRYGPPNSPVAFETIFGWVLAGKTQSNQLSHHVLTHHVSAAPENDILCSFWEVEELRANGKELLSVEDQGVLNHFKANHYQTEEGRFVVPLPRRSDIGPLGESRSQAVRRFVTLERSLIRRNQFAALDSVMREYLNLSHAEQVPAMDLKKSQNEVFYLPIHAVYKSSSATTKIRAVFDASAKSTSGVSLNDSLFVGPTVHSPLIDVLMRFRLHKIAVTADISKMYRAIELDVRDRDLHRYVWRSTPSEILKDYRMTRVTFGVSASSFVANMCVRQNALNLAHQYPLAAKTAEESFYVDDCLAGANDVRTAIQLYRELHELFSRGGFHLHKWDSNNPEVLSHIKPESRDEQGSHPISNPSESTRTLGLEWMTNMDQFRVTVSQLPSKGENLTKRMLVSDIARVFDGIGWFSPAIVKVKILLQRLWEEGIGWDDPAPPKVHTVWERWRRELPYLVDKSVPRCYFQKHKEVILKSLHGFSDASEDAYGAVVYMRIVNSDGSIHVTLVISKTKVAPIKRLSIPRLELCGALLLSRLLTRAKDILKISVSDVTAWTDSTVVLGWLTGNARRFKTFVGNRVAQITSDVPSNRWKHVAGSDNPADSASRGLYPSELVHHQLWWNGPDWLRLHPTEWPSETIPSVECDELEREVVTHAIIDVHTRSCITPPDRYSSYGRLQRVIGWLNRFISNCRSSKLDRIFTPYLRLPELQLASHYLCSIVQSDHFTEEIKLLRKNRPLPKGNCLLPLSPYMDSENLLRVGGRQRQANISYLKMHPVILHGKHPITRLMIASEHKRLLHGGPTLVMSSLSCRFHIIRARQVVRSVIRQCNTCRRWSVKPSVPPFGQLPVERVTPGPVFDKTGLDYAGPLYIKYGYVRRPVIVKAYVCVFVSLTVKSVHLELVTDLTSDAFIACLRRFISRRGYPSLLWSDHGTNFVGADRELKNIIRFLRQQTVQKDVSEFCALKNIQWKFIPEHSPHFGGIWEAAVKSFKRHLKRVVGNVKLTYEEAYTTLTQIESCLNSRPLVSVDTMDEDGIEVLTPGHFLIGRPLTALPDPAISYQSMSLLKRWNLCQLLVRHFWKRWSREYLVTLQRIYKWQYPNKGLEPGDVVLLIEDGILPTNWPLAKVVKVYPGDDGVVRVVDIKTAKGSYRRPVHKLASLLPKEPELELI